MSSLGKAPTTDTTDPNYSVKASNAAASNSSFVSRYPLRVILVALIVGLMALGMVIAGAMSAALLRANLQQRVNEQLIQGIQNPQFSGNLSDELGRSNPSRRGYRGFDAFTNDLYQQLANRDGQVLQQGGRVDDPPIIKLPPPDLGIPYEASSASGSGTWQAITIRIGPNLYLTTAKETSDITKTVSNLILFETLVGGIVTLLAGIAGYLLVRKSLEPLNQVEHAAGLISQGDLSQRAPELPITTEVGSLARSLNIMLNQVEQSFEAQRASELQARASEERMRQFVADASHELRTPLTSILGYAELNRERIRADSDDVRTTSPGGSDTERIASEAHRMRRIVEDLLLLASLDQDHHHEFHPTDLLSVTTDAIQSIQASTPTRKIDLLVNSTQASIVLGDESALRRVLLNLLQNAVNYTPDDTPIVVTVSTDNAATIASVEVRDFGPGISETDLARIFERFYRGDKSRSRTTGGMGLGLAIVESIIQNHGGNVTGTRGVDGTGMIFKITVPLAK